MAEKDTPEAADTSLDVHVPQGGVALLDANQTKFEAIIRFAEQTEKIGRALDNIRTFVLKRAFPGDWLRFGDKIEMSGAACERILSALGMSGVEASFTNWRYWKDTGNDKNGEWFVWFYEADVRIGGLLLEKVQGRAGSRDKFFGYARGAFKDLADVKESDIRMAARRGVIKEGVKVALGLRNVPYDAAQSLGLDPKKIKTVEFGSNDDKSHAEATKTDKDGGLRGVLKEAKPVRKGKNKKTGAEWVIYAATLDSGAVAETFDEKLCSGLQSLIGKRVILFTTPNKDPKYAPNLQEFREDTEAPAAQDQGVKKSEDDEQLPE